MRFVVAATLLTVAAFVPTSHADPHADPNVIGQPAARQMEPGICIDASVRTEHPLHYDVTVAGSLAFVARLQNGLDVYDVAQPGTPLLLDSYQPPGRIMSVVVAGGYAYICNEDVANVFQTVDRGIAIISIANPSNVTPVGLLLEPKRPEAAQLVDSLLYVADASSTAGKLWIVDVSDPFAPGVIGSYASPNAVKGVSVVDSLAYLAASAGGMVVLNVADPASPVFVASLPGVSPAYDISVTDTVACIARVLDGIALVDVSNPASPVLLGSYDTPGSANKVQVLGDFVHVADIAGGYLLVDISDPVHPQLVATAPYTDRTLGLYSTGTRTFAAEDTFFTVYELSEIGGCGNGAIGPCEDCDDSNFVRGDGCGDCRLEEFVYSCSQAQFSTIGLADGLCLRDSLLFVADGSAGLQVYNARYTAAPLYLGGCNTPGVARRVDAQGNLAAVADQNGGLRLIDVSDPTRPLPLGSWNPGGPVRDVRLVDSLAYVTCGGSFHVVNVSHPDSPFAVASLSLLSDGLDLEISGDRAFVADGDYGISLIDISNPASPTKIGSHSFAGITRDLAVKDDTVYVASSTGGLSTMLALPSGAFQTISQLPSVNSRQVARQGKYLYAAHSGVGLKLFDVTVPTAPQLVETMPFSGTQNLLVNGGRVFQGSEHVIYLNVVSIRGERWCGNGIVEPGESCDDSNYVSGDGCDPCCQLETPPALCGNGNVEFPEECDDGNLVGGDGCNGLCESEPPVCGNGILEYPEPCDDGNLDPADGCNASCQLVPVCGDGVVVSPEECDDGGRVSGDLCDSNCQYEHTCGDGNLELGEECDDGNSAPLDGCSATCRLEECQVQLAGDVNGSHTVTSSDIIALVTYCFKSGPPPTPCEAVADVNCSGAITSADIIRLVDYVFKGPGLCNICGNSPLADLCLD